MFRIGFKVTQSTVTPEEDSQADPVIKAVVNGELFQREDTTYWGEPEVLVLPPGEYEILIYEFGFDEPMDISVSVIPGETSD